MAKQPRSLSGKVVVITGGGRGIGAATARALVGRGARVAIGDVDLPTAERTAQELGGGTLARYLDVTDRAGFTAFLDDVERELGPIDVLVNNAGIMALSPADEEADATIIRQLELNLHAVIHGSKEGMRRMKPRGSGHIVNIASVAGKSAVPGGASYAASKAAVVSLTETARVEFRGKGIDFTCVMPSFTQTELIAGTKGTRFVATIKPEDVAAAIVAAVAEPRYDVYVPKSVGGIIKLNSLLGRRIRDAMGRALGADRTFLDFDQGQRAAYEARISEPAPLEAPPALRER
jgi:NAD(P)-dependent dehydrogenase (short-subunit alcohol dehydrogenase family)